MTDKNHITKGSVTKKLISLTIPMVFGMLSMVMFNLIDTFFVARLGTEELAAMGFTFPIIMVVTSISLGFGIATSSVVSRAIGREDHHKVQRLTTDSLLISFSIVLIFSFLGLMSLDSLFRLLGASGNILVLGKQYMHIWLLAAVFIVVPMVGNSAIRACGDTLTPSLIMIFAIMLNAILDPILIFGLFGFPRMELRGAAIATVISRFFALVLSFLVLRFKKDLLDFTLPPVKEFVSSMKQIFYIGIPSAVSRLLMPLTMAVITRMISYYGPSAVAAFGVSIKIEMFVFMLVMSLSTALIPFVGQNWGAKKFTRVKEAVMKAHIFSIMQGFFFFLVFLVFSLPLGTLFGKDPEVAKYIAIYLLIVSISYGMRGCAFLGISVFNAMNKPFIATGLDLIRIFIFYIPFAYIGGTIGGLTGIFWGLCLANFSAGLMAITMSKVSLNRFA